jgi:Helitron helicase-like domain at N-terminus
LLILLGKLFQHFITDAYACVDTNNLNFQRTHQKELRAEYYSGLMDRVGRDMETDAREIGKKTILASSYPGSPRALRVLYQDAMAIVRKFGRPDFFVTFTCNPKWREIEENLLPGQSAKDRPDIVARVFKLKLDALLKDLLEEDVLGFSRAHTYVIEFQKRGLPHAHILLILHPQDRLHTSDEIDSVISAEIPDPAEDPELHELVVRHMIHQPCGAHGRSRVCMTKDGADGSKICKASFPKAFRNDTLFLENRGYPKYRRREGYVLPGSNINNAWVVPYNPWLLRKYQAHINVEVCASIEAVKYLLSYVYKGPDRTSVGLAPAARNDDPSLQSDEITQWQNARWIGTSEAVWRFLKFKLHRISPPVKALQVRYLRPIQTILT